MNDFLDAIVTYHQTIKTSLFISGFTLGSFLFSMKSVIIKTMKEEVYDQDDYKKDIESLKGIGEDIGYYDSLRNFSNLLFWSISLSFLSAIVNLTLGYFKLHCSTITCIVITLVSWVVVGRALYFFQSNWSKVFEYAENKAIEKARVAKNEKE